MMGWLDRVLAVPLIGIKFKPVLASQSIYVDALSELTKKWSDNSRDFEFKPQAGINFKLDAEDGVTYDVTGDNIIVAFTYRGKIIESPGETPKLIYTTEAQPCSVLVKRVRDEMVSFCEPIMNSIPRPVRRIGFLVDCRLDSDALPPGVSKYIDYLASPWTSVLDSCDSKITIVLNQTEELVERCHHTIKSKLDNDSQSVRLILDWQRYYVTEKSFTPDQLSEEIDLCIELASQYFQRFGMGDLDYGDDE